MGRDDRACNARPLYAANSRGQRRSRSVHGDAGEAQDSDRARESGPRRAYQRRQVARPCVYAGRDGGNPGGVQADTRATGRNRAASNGKLVRGGISPEHDRKLLRELGVKAIFTPKDPSVETIVERKVAIA